MIGRAGSRASSWGGGWVLAAAAQGPGAGTREPVRTRAGLGPPSTAVRREELGSGTRQRGRGSPFGEEVWRVSATPSPEAGSLETDVRCRGAEPAEPEAFFSAKVAVGKGPGGAPVLSRGIWSL